MSYSDAAFSGDNNKFVVCQQIGLANKKPVVLTTGIQTSSTAFTFYKQKNKFTPVFTSECREFTIKSEAIRFLSSRISVQSRKNMKIVNL